VVEKGDGGAVIRTRLIAMRPVIVLIGLGLLICAVWTGTAAAAPVFRAVTFDRTSTFNDSPFCGDATLVEHDVGRLMTAVFVQPDGSIHVLEHGAHVTSTLTNNSTGATLTVVGSNMESFTETTDPVTGAMSETVAFHGLNYLIRTGQGKPIVSAGHGVLTLAVTLDANGNPIFTPTGESSTPNLHHLTQLLCA
jgi:hypothetical protein